jgi:Tol biopolymer transport system component
MRIATGCVAIATCMSLIVAAGASGTFPGADGKIVYECSYGSFTGSHDPHEICTVTPGQSPKRLTNNNYRDQNPSFTADGTRIAYQETRAAVSACKQVLGCADIYVMKASGGGVKRLTTTASVSESDPAFSPNGKEIAVTKNPLSSSPKIEVLRARDGKVLRTLTGGSEPSWSPNGKTIAYSKLDHVWCAGADCIGGYGIYSVHAADGSGKSQLTSTTTYADGTACDQSEGCPETNGNPSWMPNGKGIAWDIYDSEIQSGYTYRMSAGGGGKSSLVPDSAVSGCPQHPAPSPSGTMVAFADGTYCASGGNPPTIFVRGISGGAATPVADGSAPDWGPAP